MRIIKLAVKNVIKMIKARRSLMLLLAFTQVLCCISVLFTYGIYTNYVWKNNDNRLYSRENNIGFDGESSCTAVQPMLEEMNRELEGLVVSVLVQADAGEGRYIYATINYEEPEEDFLDISGRSYVVGGRYFTDEEISTGARVALSHKDMSEVTLCDQTFEIVGYLKDAMYSDKDDYYYIPLYSLPAEASLMSIEFYTSRVITETEEHLVEAIVTEFLGPDFTYSAGSVLALDEQEENKKIIFLSAFVAVLSGINLLFVLGYIYNKRRRFMSISRILGALRRDLFAMTVLEVMLIALFCCLFSSLGYCFLLEPFLRRWYIYFELIYSARVYVLAGALMLAMSFAVGCLLAVGNIRRATT